MSKKHLPKIVTPIILILLAVGVYYLVISLSKKTEGPLAVSGTIEAVSSIVSPEIGGKVIEVTANEGDEVKTGETLFIIDDTLLQAQRTAAQAALDLAQNAESTAEAAVNTAQANADLALAVALQESSVVRSQDWQIEQIDGYTIPGGYYSPKELITAVKDELAFAQQSELDWIMAIDELTRDSKNAEFVDAETKLLHDNYQIQISQAVLTKALTSSNAELIEDAQNDYDFWLARLAEDQITYDRLLDTDSAKNILNARREKALALERTQAAQSILNALFTGENSLKVQAADAALNQARASATQADSTVKQAEASLALLDDQIAKLTVTAPMDGVVLTRSVELGEVLSPGSAALTLGQLDPLTITVYVPESEVGLLSLGQSANLVVDAYPGELFPAKIIHIADQAEFTPRNVQTSEGRKTTVFTVKLQMNNLNGKLKPGMPADVTFTN